MRAREMQQMLSTHTGKSLADIDRRVKPLRLMNEISTGSRRYPPHINAAEMALHLLCMAAGVASDAADVQQRLAKCFYVPDAAHAEFFSAPPRPMPIATIIAYAIEFGAAWLRKVELHEHGMFAFVEAVGSDGRQHRLFFRAADDLTEDFCEFGIMGNRLVIGAFMLHQLHRRLVADAATVETEAEVMAG